MRSVGDWLLSYWWLSWVGPTTIIAIWIAGSLLFFGFAAAVRGIRSAWIALFHPEVRREREAHEELLEELRRREYARRTQPRRSDDDDDDDDIYDPDAVSPFWNTERGRAFLKQMNDENGPPVEPTDPEGH